MSNSASELKQELIDYKDKFLYPLYIRGELGAQQIPGFNNKCVTSFNVCDIPDDFDGNIERINKLLSFSQSETEREIIKGLKTLYLKYMDIMNKKFNYDFERRKKEIFHIRNTLRYIRYRQNNNNPFDNYILLLEGLLDYKVEYDKEFYKPKFNNKTFDLNKEIEKITLMNYDLFKNMRFYYNITEQ